MCHRIVIVVLSVVLSTIQHSRTALAKHKHLSSATADDALVIDPWVPQGETPNADTTTQLNLEQTLLYADEHAPLVRAARAEASVVEASLIEARALLPENPEVSFGGGQRRVRSASGFEFEVALEQQIEIAGQRRKRKEVAQANATIAQAQIHAIRWQVHVEVHRLVIDLLLVQERIEQAQHFVHFSESMRDITAMQVQEGESAPLVLLVANADLAQSKEALLDAENTQRSLAIRLAALIGWPTQNLPPIVDTLEPLQRIDSVSTLMQIMIDNHPEVRTQELAVTASQKKHELVKRQGWPDPTIGASIAKEAGLNGDIDEWIWLAHLRLPVPVWKTNQAAKVRAEAEELVAELALEQTIVRLSRELADAVRSLHAAAERVALYQDDIVPHLQENLSLLHRAYELGEVGIHELSQTRERLLTATGQYIDARIAYYEAAATLEGLVGTELWAIDTENIP